VASTVSTAQAADESKGKKVLLLESFTAHPYVATTEKSFRERALSYGMDVTVQAAGLDAALQARQADDGIARKFDLIVVQPISEQGIVPVLTRAKQAGIPVIIVNNTPKDGTEELYITFVGQDQNEMGRIAGRAALRALKGSGRDGGKVALITGRPATGPWTSSSRRVQGRGGGQSEGRDRSDRGRPLGYRHQRTPRRPALCALRRERRPRCGLRHGR
jgi:ABC-type sugar transport system substrate-binding protein